MGFFTSIGLLTTGFIWGVVYVGVIKPIADDIHNKKKDD